MSSFPACWIHISNEALLKNPHDEFFKIKLGLEECGVRFDDELLNVTAIGDYVRSELQTPAAAYASLPGTSTDGSVVTKELDGNDTAVSEGREGCDIPALIIVSNTTHDNGNETPEGRQRNEKMYQNAMKIYCDLKNGNAFDVDYGWPDLELLVSDRNFKNN